MNKIYQKNCDYCQKYYEGEGKYFCSKSCYFNNQIGKFIGKNNSMWKGGKPKCLDCNKQLSHYSSKYCRNHAGVGKRSSQWSGGLPNCKFCTKKLSNRDSNKCLKCWNKINIGKNHNFYGKHHSQKTKDKLKIIGINRFKNFEERIKRSAQSLKIPLEQWTEFRTILKEQIRKTQEYKIWHKKIFERDNYICQFCNQRGGKLQVDHIKPLSIILKENTIKTIKEAANCKELWNINNGRTLCEQCHKQTDTYLSGALKYAQ